MAIHIYTTHTYMENNSHTSVLAMVFDTKSKCNNSQNCLSFLHSLFKFYFLAVPLSMWILVLQPQIELTPSVLEAWSPNHWLSREFSKLSFILKLILLRPQTPHACNGQPWPPLCQGHGCTPRPLNSDRHTWPLLHPQTLSLFGLQGWFFLLLHGLCLLSLLC